MRRMLLIASLLFPVVVGAAAYAAVPNYYRVLTPGAFGLTHIGSGIYTDAPRQAANLRARARHADARIAIVLGASPPPVRTILCTAQPCADIFGLKPRGVALARAALIVGPGDEAGIILTHERAHMALRRHMGLRDLWDPRYPAWFDEGLASHIARDPDHLFIPPGEARWILQTRSRRDWSRLHETREWPETYGAAAALVADIEDRIGRDGLRALIAEVAAGADFDARLRARLGADWP